MLHLRLCPCGIARYLKDNIYSKAALVGQYEYSDYSDTKTQNNTNI